MPARPVRARTSATILAVITVCATALIGVPASASAASTNVSVSPAAAKPGQLFTVSGSAPACAHQPYRFRQIYTDRNGGRSEQPAPSGGLAGADGSFSVSATVPSAAARSNLLRPFGAWQWDTLVVEFPGCAGGTDVSTNLEVLSISRNEHITLSSTSPRSGSVLHVTATNCIGGVFPAFTWVIDSAGSYFMITGSQSGSTFQGTADLAHGFRGSEHPTGPATASPGGARDSIAAVPCAQSEGPASVATADKLFHQTCVIDISIRPSSGRAATATQSRSSSSSASSPSTSATSSFGNRVVPEAVSATAIVAVPTYTG